MRIARFLIPAVALTVAVVAAPTAALAAPKAAVAMTFSATPDPVAVGKTITLSGRAAAGKTGNAGTVEFYFRKDRSPLPFYTRVATTSAAANGTFSRAVKATASGTYLAVYRGNKYRKSASRADHASVFTTRTTTKTVWQYSGTDVECGPATNGCHIYSGDLTIQPGPLNVSIGGYCRQPSPSFMLGFTDDPTSTAPEPSDGPYAAPGWRWWPFGGAFGETVLAPPITQGHFYLYALVKPAFGPASKTTCTLTVTATQQVTQKIPV